MLNFRLQQLLRLRFLFLLFVCPGSFVRFDLLLRELLEGVTCSSQRREALLILDLKHVRLDIIELVDDRAERFGQLADADCVQQGLAIARGPAMGNGEVPLANVGNDDIRTFLEDVDDIVLIVVEARAEKRRHDLFELLDLLEELHNLLMRIGFTALPREVKRLLVGLASLVVGALVRVGIPLDYQLLDDVDLPVESGRVQKRLTSPVLAEIDDPCRFLVRLAILVREVLQQTKGGLEVSR
mmetsp:Transcript_7973/g.14418  ORF Transcript_7973/g.14418 Transcript_7973/m.14418 type:complete len:241 (+) Transcript_7973:1245-1967(+)